MRHRSWSPTVSHPLFDKHRATLDRALTRSPSAATGRRTRNPRARRSTAKARRRPARPRSTRLLGKPFPIALPATVGTTGGERSPYGIDLGVTYPKVDLDACSPRSRTRRVRGARPAPRRGSACRSRRSRASTRRSFEIANAVMHTTGQAFLMAFQAGGPHAQDRGLEAVAYAWDQMRRVPAIALWEKPQGKGDPIRMEKHYRVVPRGVGLVIGCCTFPTWNGYPGPVREPRDRQRGGRQAASRGDPAARDHREDRARRARRGGLRSERRDAARARGGRRHGAEARAASRGAHHRLHRQLGQRQLARGACAAGAGLHREGRRQPGDHRLDDRPQRRRAQPRVLAVALHRPDVHGAAEHLRPARRHRAPPTGTSPSTTWPRTRSPTACASCSAIRRARSRCWAPCRTTACSNGSRRRARSARSCSTRRGRASGVPGRDVRTPLIVKLDVARRRQVPVNEWFGPIAFVIATDSTDGEPGDRARRRERPRCADAVGLLDRRRGRSTARSRSPRTLASRCRST